MKADRRNYNSKGIEVEQQTELMYKGDTIWTAVFNADKNAINVLIDRDPNVINSRGAVGECPIHMLFLYGTNEHLIIARDLITRYPKIVTQVYNEPIYFGENILHLAIVKPNPTMVEWLLSNDCLEPYRQELLNATATGEFFQIGKPSYYGEYPLGFACCTNQWNIVEILLKYGADIDTVDSHGNNILHMLAICNQPDIYAKYKARWIQQKTINALVDMSHTETIRLKSSEPPKLWNRLNNRGLTPLTLVASLGRSNMLSWLLQERKIVQWSYGDVTCELHPLDQLDLGFHKEGEDRPLCVLEVIVQNNASDLVHPILTSLVNKKWKLFVYRALIRQFFIAFTYLVIFLITTVLDHSTPKSTKDENISISDAYSEQNRQVLCKIGHAIVLTGAILKAGREIKEMSRAGILAYFSATGSIFLGNCLASSFCMCIFTVELFRLFHIPHETIILAFAALLGWGYMFFFIMPLRFTGPFVIMIYKILFNDVLRFCTIYLIFLTAFSQSFFILFHGEGFTAYSTTIKQCFLGLLGDFDLDIYIDAPHPIAAVSLLIFYVVVVAILLLNLLVAMMADTYADVKKSAKQLWHLERTRMALDVENAMSTAERTSSINKYWVEIQGERYLQVEQSSNGVIVLHGAVQSTCTQRVLTTLIEKGLKYKIKTVNMMTGKHKTPKYLQEKHPFGVIPVLIDENGYKIYESRAICRYLEIKYQGQGTQLIPKDIKGQGLFEQAASIETSYFDPHASAMVYERAFKKIRNIGETDEKRVDQLREQLNQKLDVYDKILSKQKYLAGDAFTLADLFHLPYGTWLFKIDEGNLINSRPNVKKWWENITSRSSWKSVQSLA